MDDRQSTLRGISGGNGAWAPQEGPAIVLGTQES
jgi:hypothetical protein